jgi:hypothetical protein
MLSPSLFNSFYDTSPVHSTVPSSSTTRLLQQPRAACTGMASSGQASTRRATMARSYATFVFPKDPCSASRSYKPPPPPLQAPRLLLLLHPQPVSALTRTFQSASRHVQSLSQSTKNALSNVWTSATDAHQMMFRAVNTFNTAAASRLCLTISQGSCLFPHSRRKQLATWARRCPGQK